MIPPIVRRNNKKKPSASGRFDRPLRLILFHICPLDLYPKGYSIVKIVNELFSRNIPSPTGKERWCKRSIDTMLSNEKYTGDIIVLKTYSSGFPNNRRIKNTNTDEQHPMYMVKNNHEPIISFETFKAVQTEKIRRSNIVTDSTGKHRSDSLSAQVSYYSKLIQSHNDWEYVGVYTEPCTGRKPEPFGKCHLGTKKEFLGWQGKNEL